jgi:hypothetical protein
LSLAKVTLMLKQSVELCRYVLCDGVAACNVQAWCVYCVLCRVRLVCVLCAVKGETGVCTVCCVGRDWCVYCVLCRARLVCVLCAVQGETGVCTVCCAGRDSPCTAHSTHTIPGHNTLPHHRIIHNGVILPIVLT